MEWVYRLLLFEANSRWTCQVTGRTFIRGSSTEKTKHVLNQQAKLQKVVEDVLARKNKEEYDNLLLPFFWRKIVFHVLQGPLLYFKSILQSKYLWRYMGKFHLPFLFLNIRKSALFLFIKKNTVWDKLRLSLDLWQNVNSQKEIGHLKEISRYLYNEKPSPSEETK